MRRLNEIANDLVADHATSNVGASDLSLVERRARQRIAAHLERATVAPDGEAVDCLRAAVANLHDLDVTWWALLGVDRETP